MTNPVYKIEVWEPGGGSALHTITKDAISIYSKEVVTKGIGNFSFTVPTKKNGSDYYYNDIDPFDTVKIWYGYDSISGNANFIGKVLKVSGPLSTASGYIRQISGLSQGEILQRRQKTEKWYAATAASTVVTDFANDLSLGTGEIAAEAIQVDLNIDTNTYFELLKYVSDYYYDASNKIQRDFYVDISNNLKWASRPFRTTGVESFTVGKDIIHYNVVRQINEVKNNIILYGVRDKHYPTDKDLSEATTNWSGSSAATQNTDRKVGTYSIQTTQAGTSTYIWVDYLDSGLSLDCNRWKDYQHLKYWAKVILSLGKVTYTTVRILCPDHGNYYHQNFTSDPDKPFDGTWTQISHDLGPGTGWSVGVGSPDWNDARGFRVLHNYASQSGVTNRIDGAHFANARFKGSASDATSQTNYGQRDLEIIDDKLTSDSDCSKRAEAILMQKKDAVVQIILTVAGNTNVLVGDRLVMTLPAEQISAQNFDVLSVEHSFSQAGFITKASMVDSANTRKGLSIDLSAILGDAKQRVKELGRDEKTVG